MSQLELIIEKKLYEDYKILIKNAICDSYEPNNVLTALKFIKTSIEQDEYLEELLENELIIQIIISDYDKFYWFTANINKIECGRGKINNPTDIIEAPVNVITPFLLKKRFDIDKLNQSLCPNFHFVYEFINEARGLFNATIYGDEMKHYDVELIFQEEINEKNNLEN